MRHAVVTLLASFFGVLVALFAFHIYTRYEADRERAADDAEMQAKLEQGRQLIERTLAEERAVLAIRSDLTSTSAARMAVAEFYMATGRMPASNAEAGLPEPQTYKGQSLRSLSVADGGELILTFDSASGVEGGTLEWLPDLTGIESMGLQWQCRTRDFPQIVRVLPNCKYLPVSAADIATN
jgi:hypothetical protein